MRSSTSVWSAICGIHFGETNAVASTAGSPASARRSISSTLTAVGTAPRSFCSPSRGPTSTIRTDLFKRKQLRALEHLLAGGIVDFLHHAVGRRGDRVLHLHRFQDKERLALAHLGAGGSHHLDHLSRHRRGERAGAGVLIDAGQLRLQRKPPVIAFAENMPVLAIAHRARREDAAVEADLQAAVWQALASQAIALAVDGEAQPIAQELHPGGMARLALHENEVVMRVLVQAPAVDAVPRGVGIGRY